MLVLGIESTCDEMAFALVQDGKNILSHVTASQASLHQKYGGVFPEMAAREHVDLLIPTLRQTLQEADVDPAQIDLIAVANGPGLMGSLLVGLNCAKSLSLAWNRPLVGVNHVEAHLYAAMMSQEIIPNVTENLDLRPRQSLGIGNQIFSHVGYNRFPALGIVISGGHTLMVRIDAIGSYEWIGTTVDDAIGEAFDKVASLLGLPYPGGPAIEELAKSGDPLRYPFKAGHVKGMPWSFSFSGLKTQILYALKGQNGNKDALNQLPPSEKAHIAASFQETALRDIVSRAKKALNTFPAQAIYIGGGVSNNQRLRALFAEFELEVCWPSKGLSLDNAAMIAGLGYWNYLSGKEQGLALEGYPTLRFGQDALLGAGASRG